MNDKYLFILLMFLMLLPLFVSWLVIKNFKTRNAYIFAFSIPFLIYPPLFIVITMLSGFGGLFVVVIFPFGLISNFVFVGMNLFSGFRKNKIVEGNKVVTKENYLTEPQGREKIRSFVSKNYDAK